MLLGSAATIARVRAHPLMRALRPDKLTVAALCATLALYRDGREREVPAVGMLSASADELRARADHLAQVLGAAGVAALVEGCRSTVGGGAMPLAELPSWAVTVSGRADAVDAGATDVEEQGRFRWITGEPFEFQAFHPNEPDNRDGTQDCLIMNGATRRWHDRHCGVRYPALCEREP